MPRSLDRAVRLVLCGGMERSIHYRAICYFEAVRRWGSIREAARRLDVAASAVNRQILKFESDFGLPLFERLPEGMRLTPAGEIFARHAVAVLQDENRLASEMEALKGLRRGEVSIISAESVNTTFLPRVIGHMAMRYPRIELKIRTAGSNEIPAALIAGDADLGLAFSLASNPALSQVAIGRFHLGAVMRPDHRLGNERQISFANCAGYKLVLPSAELSIFSLLERQLRRFRSRLDVAAEVNSLELMRNLTIELNAISFQASIGLEADLAAGRLVHVPLYGSSALATELAAYVREGRPLPMALEAFLAIVRDELARREAEDAPP